MINNRPTSKELFQYHVELFLEQYIRDHQVYTKRLIITARIKNNKNN